MNQLPKGVSALKSDTLIDIAPQYAIGPLANVVKPGQPPPVGTLDK